MENDLVHVLAGGWRCSNLSAWAEGWFLADNRTGPFSSDLSASVAHRPLPSPLTTILSRFTSCKTSSLHYRLHHDHHLFCSTSPFMLSMYIFGAGALFFILLSGLRFYEITSEEVLQFKLNIFRKKFSLISLLGQFQISTLTNTSKPLMETSILISENFFMDFKMVL